ncbi:hypothetical protein HU200_007283 [Digitaria exilis]|uniref:acetylglutamate kinase n=1 Tax=Digitaria exilis TaxID=1010633 RepID=A0A835KSL7_9POAL|nr:hypothetical protein HU200_007283 [Digitaria exilis]
MIWAQQFSPASSQQPSPSGNTNVLGSIAGCFTSSGHPVSPCQCHHRHQLPMTPSIYKPTSAAPQPGTSNAEQQPAPTRHTHTHTGRGISSSTTRPVAAMLLAKPHPSSLASASTPLPKPIPAANHIATPLAASSSSRSRRGGLRVSAASVAAAAVAPPAAPALSRVDVLSEALPFIQRFKGKTVVVKYGGAAMKSPELQASVIRDLVLLSCVGLRPVLVHGGGPEINSWLARVGVEPQFRNGLRVTDAVTMEVVEMVLVGKVNKQLVSLISLAGATAVGLCGKDARLLTARPSRDAASLGFVGEVTRVDPTVLRPIIESGHIPVIATVAADEAGQAYNINADTAAGEIAAAVGAEKLLLLTDVSGILADRNDPGSLVREVDVAGVRRMVAEGKVGGGMIPKVECCVRAIAQGVRTASIIDGRVPHSLLLEILTDEGTGTMITG